MSNALQLAPAGAGVILGLGLAVSALAYCLSRLAARAGLIPDMPNGRSNHSLPTPRSGGAALIVSVMAGVGAAALFEPGFAILALNLAAITFLAFAVGLADDLLVLSPAWKFAGQFGAAGLFLILFGPLADGPLPFAGEIALGAAGAALTVLWIVGFMNAYNFMDGVNGLAASCGLFVLAALAVASAFAGAPMAALAAALVAAALLGFLPVNFPRARVFMGDSGSQGIGLLIAALALIAAQESKGAVSALFAPTAMAPFLFDVGFTLVHRARRGRNVFSAHREHLYQLLTRLGATHAQATSVYVTLTAVSTGAAFLMLRVNPALQWLAPALLIVLFFAPARALYRVALAKGLLDARPAEIPGAILEETPELPKVAPAQRYPHAAE